MSNDNDDVRSALADLTLKVDRLTDAVTAATEPSKARHRGTPDRLTAQDVTNATL